MGQHFDIIHAHDWLAAKALVSTTLSIPPHYTDAPVPIPIY